MGPRAGLASIAGMLVLLSTAAWGIPNADLRLRCAERVPGVCTAPAWVHVDGSGTTDTDPAVRPFHDLRYHIDYGDVGPYANGTWSTGWRGESRNEEASPIGGHVYESGGTFTVTLTVTDAQGNVDVDTAQINIQSEDAGWPAGVTRCVSASGDFAGCPSGAERITSSDYDATLQRDAGTRSLYRCGETFTASSNPYTTNAPDDGSLVSGFGSCQDGANPATVRVTTESVHTGNLGGWRFRDLRFEHQASGDGVRSFNVTNNNITRFLFFRSESLETAACPGINTTYQDGTYLDFNALVDWTCTNTKQNANTSWRMMWHQARYGGLIGGNLLCDAPSALYWRTMGLNRTLVAHMSHTVPPGSGCTLTQQFRNAGAASGRVQEYLVIRDQRVLDESAESYRTLALCFSHGCSSGDSPSPTRDVLIEDNFTTYGPGKPNSTTIGIQAQGVRVTIRNNLWDYRGQARRTGQAQSVVQIEDDGLAAHDVHVYNNTAVRSGDSDTFRMVNDTSSGSGHVARNNLLYDEDSLDDGLTNGVDVATNNVHLNGPDEGCPFAGSDGACELSPPSAFFNANEFRIRATGGARAAVVDAGYVFPPSGAFVFTDAFANCRGSDAPDIGAHEFGATPCPVGGSSGPPTASPPAAPVLLP